MNPPGSNLPLEKIFTGAFYCIAGLLLLTAVVTLIRLVKLSRGPGRSAHRAPLPEIVAPPVAKTSPVVTPSTSGEGEPARAASVTPRP